MAHDGKVTIDVGLDNSGVEKGVKEVAGEFGGLKNVLNETSKTISDAMSKPIADAHAQIRKELNSTQKQIEQYQKRIQMAESKKMPLVEQAERLGVELDEAKGKLAELQAQQKAAGDILAAAGSRELSSAELNSYLDAYAQKPELDAAVAKQQEQVNGLQKQWDNVNNRIDTYNFRIDQANNEITAQKANAADLSARLASGGQNMASAMDGATESTKSAKKETVKAEKETKRLGKSASSASGHFNSMSKAVKGFGSRLKSIVSGALVFNLISSGLRELTSSMGKTLKTNDAFSSALAKLKGALLTAFQPIYDAVAPALTFLMNLLTNAAVAVARFFSYLSGKSVDEYAAAAKSLYEEANAIDQVSSSAKEAKKSLAGFDELTVLQDNSDSTSSSSDSVSPDFSAATGNGISTFVDDLGSQSESATEKINGLAGAVESFAYEVLGKIDPAVAYNFQNATLLAENSAKRLSDTLTSVGSGGLADYFARKIEADGIALTAALTAISGYWDIQAALNLGDGRGLWEGLGRILGANGQVVTGYLEEWGIENFLGFDVEEMRKTYFPIFEEIPNLFRGVTTEQAKALKKLNSSFKKFQKNLSQISWSDAIITENEAKTLLSSFDEVLSEVSDHAAQSKSDAIENINELVSKGLMTEDEAKAALDSLEGMYSLQETLLANSKAEINKILEKAKKEHRALTEEEKTIITNLTKAAQEEVISVVKAGANDRTRIIEELNATEEGLSKVRLSQIIQFANDEYNAQVDAANATYEDTIAEADKLYYELGVISEEQYNTVVEAAKKQKDDQIKAASEAKKELIAKAQETAGEVANAVDPDTGEILSNWEQTWNGMFSKITEMARKIIDKCRNMINKIISFLNAPLEAINALSGALNGRSVFGVTIPSFSVPTIPYLAQGAVLPANKPFMAVVGDQKHGTNIEAPLTTIQEAVALVMQDQTTATLAAAEAIISRQEKILAAIEAIELGDTTIGEALARYSRKQAVIRGGV